MEKNSDRKHNSQSVRSLIASIKKHLQALDTLGDSTNNWYPNYCTPCLLCIERQYVIIMEIELDFRGLSYSWRAIRISHNKMLSFSVLRMQAKYTLTTLLKTKTLNKGVKSTNSTSHISIIGSYHVISAGNLVICT